MEDRIPTIAELAADADRFADAFGIERVWLPPAASIDSSKLSTGAALRARPFVWRDPKTIPPRRFLYGRHYVRRIISATVAPGGVGKSSLDLVDAIAMVTGRPLLGIKPAERLRVWYHNGEDGLEEIERRIAAICLYYDIGPEELGGLFVTSGRETQLVLARESRNGIVTIQVAEDGLREEILRERIDLMIIDPFVSCHEVSENDNTRINAVVRLLVRVADATNAGIELVHHVRKGQYGQSEITVEDGRGAGALKDGVRSARVLNAMTPEEAQKAGVEARRSFFRVDTGKANLAPLNDHSDWYQLVSVDIGNGTPDYPSDHIGVVVAWKKPSAFDDITVADLKRAQSAVNSGGPWRKDPQAKQWVGNEIARVLGIELDKAGKEKVRQLLRTWTANGMFTEYEAEDEKRMTKVFVRVGAAA